MLYFITLVLCLQLAGELLAGALSLPLPGPLVGMGLLFTLLAIRGGPSEAFAQSAQQLLAHFSLLFVPAGVGIILHLRLLHEQWLAVGAALVLGTLATVAVSAALMAWLLRRRP